MLGLKAEFPAKDLSETVSGYWQLNMTRIRKQVKKDSTHGSSRLTL